MAASREELLVYGYIKEFHQVNDVELPPNDIIGLFVAWIKLRDHFDVNTKHSSIEIEDKY